MYTPLWITSRLLSTAARLNERHHNRSLQDLGVTHSGATTLRALSDSGPINQAGLAILVQVQAQTMGNFLEKLEVKGLVARTRGTRDGRTMRTHITVNGSDTFKRVDQMAEASIEAAGLSDIGLRNALFSLIDTFETTTA